MGQPTIQVRANRLSAPGNPRHLVIVVDDGKGSKTYYRGGPESGNGGSSDATRGSTGSGRSSGGSGFGRVVAESGPYTPDSIDFDPNAEVIYQANLNPADVSRVKNSLNNQMNAVNEANINYFPTGPNSNSTVGTAMRNLGVNLQIPNGMWVPGVEQQLVDRNGRRASIEAEGTRVATTSGTNTTENNLQAQSEQVYSKTLAMAPKDLTLTDDQRVAKALIAAKFDAPSVAAVIENGSPKEKTMDESSKGDYAQGVAKTAEANKEAEADKIASAGKNANREIEA
jgi:hypothetical protein